MGGYWQMQTYTTFPNVHIDWTKYENYLVKGLCGMCIIKASYLSY